MTRYWRDFTGGLTEVVTASASEDGSESELPPDVVIVPDVPGDMAYIFDHTLHAILDENSQRIMDA